ncbi:hypothetical protein N2601_29070 (plasmid) [Rhizobium sp. CB3060]|uniref:hypothetical protein n=1 Tax=Rhizobium sp. CB3060 TaxID=3138255 RepID=UPI0021A81159|nr:hypothetical protein [Rhizobium tropici]UWU24271.1 hypothetical protein N2601_29070 [Rhizobium tropici]
MRKMDCWRAKWMFSCPIKLYAVGDGGTVITHRALRRSQVVEFFSKLELCLIGLDACASVHYWANSITQLGHKARMMPAAYVKVG